MTLRYVDTPLTDLDIPEPIRAPRTLTPRYIEVSPEGPVPRQQIPDAAYGLPAYWSTLPPRPVLPPPDPPPDRPAVPTVPDLDLARFRQAFAWLEAIRPGLTKLGEDLQRILAQCAPTAGDLWVDTSPNDPRAHALWLRQHRNTGPSRDLTHQRRPRQHPGGPR
jgi:hypothetical protein